MTDSIRVDRDGLLPASERKVPTWAFYLTAFFLPALVMWCVYIALQVFPFGTNSVLVLDLNGQYVYFYEDLREKLTSGGSLLYTWTRALGGENMGIFAYYIASPFALITLLFPKSMITEALLTMILAKVGLCGMTMFHYLRSVRKVKNPIQLIIFSSMYALSSYAVVQAHNTMWIDELIILPLVVLGIENLIYRRRFILYVASLAYACLTNFYIGFMVCLFSLFYFFYWYAANNGNDRNNMYGEGHHFIKSLVRFGFSSLLAVGIACVVLLPAYYSLRFGKTTFSNPSYEFSQQFDFLDFVAKLYPGSYDTVRPEGLPFVYCGTLTLILLPLFFLCRKVTAREKIAAGAFLAFLLICFNGSLLDLVWHGLQRPNWLNYRYSFVFCFLMIVFAERAFEELTSFNYHYLVGTVGALGLLLLVIQKQDYEWFKDLQCVWFSLFMLGVMMCALHSVSRGYLKQSGVTVILIAVVFELYCNALFCTMDLDDDVVISSRKSYTDFFDEVTPAVESVKSYEQSHDNDLFYRFEKTKHRKTNDNMTLQNYGITNSTSTLNASVISFLHDMGYSAKSHWSKYLGGTPVSDSLLGIKYVLTEKETEDLTREEIYQNYEDSLFGYLNSYALALAYASDEQVLEIDRSSYDTPFEYLNALVSSMLGETVQLFRPVPSTDSTDNLTRSYTTGHIKFVPTNTAIDGTIDIYATVPEEAYGNELFMYIPSDYPRECKLYINGVQNDTYFANETHRVMSLGVMDEANTSVGISLTLKKDNLYIKNGVSYFYWLDTEVYRQAMETLAQGNLELTTFSDTYLKGNITVPESMGVLFTSIPYDEGWHVSVDGVEAELKKTNDALLAVDITPGEHEVELYYMPSAYVIGWSVSVVSVTVFVGSILISLLIRKRRYAKIRKAHEDALHDTAHVMLISQQNEADSDLIRQIASEDENDDFDFLQNELNRREEQAPPTDSDFDNP